MTKIKYRAKGPELLIDLVEQCADILSQEGSLDPERAESLAISIADRMAKRWSPGMIYFPTGNWNGRGLIWHQLSERDWKIYSDYRGDNRREICDRYQIRAQRLYQIIAAVRRYLAAQRTSFTANNPGVRP